MRDGPYSLWLTPDATSGRGLADLIASLAARFASPVFAPHLTLLGGIRQRESAVRERATGLARQLVPLAFRVAGLRHGDEYFRAVYLDVLAEPALVGARALADALFTVPVSGPFDPHVSLVYGRLEASQRDGLMEELRGLVPSVIRAPALQVWYTGGDVAWWRAVAAFDLEGEPE